MAKDILTREFDMMLRRETPGKLKVEFFGGEPLLKFDVIKEVTQWIEDNDPGVDCLLSVTSNGTLLDDEKKEWFTRHKDKIRIVMSVDGSQEMQETNRGHRAGEVPLDFVRRTWPGLRFKSTISRANLPGLADGIIYLLEQGHVVAPNLAQGEDWQPGDEIVYKRELEKLADWQLAHPDVEPMNFFNQPFFSLLEPHCSRPPKKNCGTGETESLICKYRKSLEKYVPLFGYVSGRFSMIDRILLLTILSVRSGNYDNAAAPAVKIFLEKIKDLPLPQCFDCTSCQLRKDCFYQEIIGIESKIQALQLQHPVDQSRIGNIVRPLTSLPHPRQELHSAHSQHFV